ncbi:HipA domain-containing protein [Cupriavidus sp. CuC1]|uniref:HipA domain-containing protein n=1 Tax=Cupriavidus sp. CuC1 TaxID=3373131 RepID=UPI0037D221BD
MWRRLVFNFLICNTDDHLRNTGLLYDARGKGWRLAPAFDLNPMPGDRRESKTWLTEDSGPIDSKRTLMDDAHYFRLTQQDAATNWAQVEAAVSAWRNIGLQLGMSSSALVDFAPAMELR